MLIPWTLAVKKSEKDSVFGLLVSDAVIDWHRTGKILALEEKWKIGLEAYYFSPQKLNDGATGRQYWLFGFMAEKLWDNFSIFINFENFGDTRQTRFDTIFTGSITKAPSYLSPVTSDLFAGTTKLFSLAFLNIIEATFICYPRENIKLIGIPVTLAISTKLNIHMSFSISLIGKQASLMQ